MWPFKKKNKNTYIPEAIYFKNSEGFFEYQCSFGQTNIKPNDKAIVAIVLDAQKEFGAQYPVKIDNDGKQTAALRVASEDGGFVVISPTASNKGEKLSPGDLVFWLPVTQLKEALVENIDVDPRFSWVGLIIAKIKPEMGVKNQDFSIICTY